MHVFKEDKITIIYRDVNGKREIIEFDNEASVLSFIDEENLSEEDEILIVAYGHLCLYSALTASYPLDIDDLTGFFA